MVNPAIKGAQGLRVALAQAYTAVQSRLTGRPRYHVAVLGYPRGGTSLLHNMLSATLPGFRFDDFETRCVERLHRLGDYGTKTPLDVLDVPQFDRLNVLRKRVVVLAVDRDIRDVLTSKHPNVADRYFIGHDASWWPQNPEFSAWQYDAAGVTDVYAAMGAAAQAAGIEYARVRYEDLIADADAVQEDLQARFGLPFEGHFSGFHEPGKRRAYRYEQEQRASLDPALVFEQKPVETSRQGKWRRAEHRTRIIEQFSACEALFDILIESGYEPDRCWYEEYMSVTEGDPRLEH